MTTSPGLETLLLEELQGLGLTVSAEPAGLIVLEGGWEAVARVAVRSRTASRVLLPLRSFAAKNRAMLYDQVRRLDWRRILPSGATIAVHAVGNSEGSEFTLSYAGLRIKDAICDTFRAGGEERPDVDRHHPDARIAAFVNSGRCSLSLDLVGEPLHRRGYREEGAEAPLRENRAAALLLFAGYDGSLPLVDPFCGSGTIAIEAALLAARRAPGLLRALERTACVRLRPESRPAFEAERRDATREALAALPHPITGLDREESAVEVSRRNARRAGVADLVHFETGDALELEAPPSFVVTNPPYGERLETAEGAALLLREFVHRVKHHAVGSRLAVVLPRGPLEHALGLRPERRLALESGDLGLRFLRLELYAGSRKGTAGK